MLTIRYVYRSAKYRGAPMHRCIVTSLVKRKDATIQVLRQAMKDRGLSKLAEAKFEIKRWKKKHQKLKNETKERHASLSAASQADEDITRLTSELKEKDDIITNLENEKLMLEETVEQLNTSMEQEKRGTRDEKTYSLDIRMMVYDAVVNQVPTTNIPTLIQTFFERSGITLKDVPHRNTVEQMTRELGVIYIRSSSS